MTRATKSHPKTERRPRGGSFSDTHHTHFNRKETGSQVSIFIARAKTSIVLPACLAAVHSHCVTVCDDGE